MTSGDLSPDLRRVQDTFHCPMSPLPRPLHWSLSQPFLGPNMRCIVPHQSHHCHLKLQATSLSSSRLNATNHRNMESQHCRAIEWAAKCVMCTAVTKPIYCPLCIEDINNGRYLNILIPAWPVTPTRRENSHRIVPGPIITHYWQKLVCPSSPLYLGIQIQ